MTDDPKTPRPRQSLLLPVLIPVLLLVGIGVVLWGFSRLLLRMEPHAATATALVVAAGIVTVVGIAASRKRVSNGALADRRGRRVRAWRCSPLARRCSWRPRRRRGRRAMAWCWRSPRRQGAAAKGFQDTALTAPSDTAFTITFDNQDPSVEHDVVVASADPAKDPSAQLFVDGGGITGVVKRRLRGAAPARGQVLLLLPVPPHDDDRDAHDLAGREYRGRRRRALDLDHGVAVGLRHRQSDVPGRRADVVHVQQRRRGRPAQPGDLHRRQREEEPVPRRHRHGGRDGRLHDPRAEGRHVLLPVRHPYGYERHRHGGGGTRWRWRRAAAERPTAEQRTPADVSAAAHLGARRRRAAPRPP